MAGKQIITSRVYRYFKDRPDTVITLSEVEKDLGLAPGSASPSLSRMSTSIMYRIAKGPHRGSYIYHSGPRKTVEAIDAVSAYPAMESEPKPETTEAVPAYAKPKPVPVIARCYEYIGKLNDVADVIRGDDERMYVAMTLDRYVTGKP